MKAVLSPPAVAEQIVAFADLSGFHRRICAKLRPEEIFVFLTEYYATVQRALNGSEGRIIKVIGDAILLLFPAPRPPDAIAALKRVKAAVDVFLSQKGHDSRVCIKAHVGEVAAGMIGMGEWERFDVCGVTVNQTALLPAGEWVLSDELKTRLTE